MESKNKKNKVRRKLDVTSIIVELSIIGLNKNNKHLEKMRHLCE